MYAGGRYDTVVAGTVVVVGGCEDCPAMSLTACDIKFIGLLLILFISNMRNVAGLKLMQMDLVSFYNILY